MAPTSMVATPLVSLYLILLPLGMMLWQESAGFSVVVPTVSHECPDSRIVVVKLRADHRIFINQDETDFSTLKDKLAAIFRTRYEHIVFIDADTNARYDEFARVLDAVQGATEAMHVALITPRIHSDIISGMENCLIVPPYPPSPPRPDEFIY